VGQLPPGDAAPSGEERTSEGGEEVVDMTKIRRSDVHCPSG
jgi:hypothetical protein